MRGLLPFLTSRLFRAAVALWLVSTVVFVVMRLSGDPVPLLLPPDAPQSEFARVRADAAGCVANRRHLRRQAQLGHRPGHDGTGARRPVGADVLHRDSLDPDRLAEPRPLADLGAR